MFFDSHCHLSSEQLAARFDEVLHSARAANVTGFCNIGDTVVSSRAVLQQAEVARERGFLCGASVGVHPQNAREFSASTVEELRVLAKCETACAIGEIGLDYFYDETHSAHPGAPRKVQQNVLRTQLELAAELDLPVVLHNRDADEDLLRIIDDYASNLRGVFHCFSSSIEVARQVLALGFHLGFGGIATFKNAEIVREAARLCPLEKLLLETDAPYIAPIPHRGKTNEPQFLPHTAAVVAPLHNISVKELAAITSENARRLFAL